MQEANQNNVTPHSTIILQTPCNDAIIPLILHGLPQPQVNACACMTSIPALDLCTYNTIVFLRTLI